MSRKNVEKIVHVHFFVFVCVFLGHESKYYMFSLHGKHKPIFMEGAATSTNSATATNAAAANNAGEGGTNNAEVTNKETMNKGEENKEKKEEGKQEEKKRTARETFYERFKTDYPNDNADDEESVYSRINERNSEYDRLKKDNDDFRKVVEDHPQFGAMFLDMGDGKDFIESLLSRFSKDDIIAAYDDPAMAKKLSEAQAAYLQGEENNKKLCKEGEDNVKKSVENYAKWCEKNGVEGDEVNELWGEAINFYTDGLKGIFSEKLFDMLRKGKNHDADVKDAEDRGELKGHNTKVQTVLAKQKPAAGIPPTFDGGQGGVGKEPKPKNKRVVRNPFSNEDIEIEE